MNEITAITPQVKDKTRCNIYLDGKFCCGLGLETTVKNRLKVGLIITPEKLSELQLESEKNTALDKALTHISATRKTEKEIRAFLRKKGYLSDVCDFVVEKMQGYDFINDSDYAKDYAQFASAKKGKRLIKMELKAKGVSEEFLENALLEVDDGAQETVAVGILQKYMRNKTVDKETLYKAFRYLLSKGFEYETAKKALEQFGELDDE